jgi:hypothetical protein
MRQEWLSHLVFVNRAGVNRILAKYGYLGTLEPQTREETIEAIEMAIEYNGTDAIRDFMMVQPEFEAIKQLVMPKNRQFVGIPVEKINQVVQTPTQQQPTQAVQPLVLRNATGIDNNTGLFDIPANDIIKGAIIFGIIYFLTKKT